MEYLNSKRGFYIQSRSLISLYNFLLILDNVYILLFVFIPFRAHLCITEKISQAKLAKILPMKIFRKCPCLSIRPGGIKYRCFMIDTNYTAVGKFNKFKFFVLFLSYRNCWKQKISSCRNSSNQRYVWSNRETSLSSFKNENGKRNIKTYQISYFEIKPNNMNNLLFLLYYFHFLYM